MGFDLSSITKIQDLTPEHIQFIAYQLFRGLKILDYGLARSCFDAGPKKPDILGGDEKTELMTGYVATRWYRAPELIWHSPHYNSAVDIWSAGCIIAELIIHKVLFPGNGPMDQLIKIIEIRGMPPPNFLDKITATSKEAKQFLNSQDLQDHTYIDCNLEDVLLKPAHDTEHTHIQLLKQACSLIDGCLQWDPTLRSNALQCLAHSFFQKTLSDITDEPECPENLAIKLDTLLLSFNTPNNSINDTKTHETVNSTNVTENNQDINVHYAQIVNLKEAILKEIQEFDPQSN